ncbi:acetate--CoA ligase family protein [Nocardia africana]|uniref:Acetate--CoA ligase family protein n=1 Tax=Nocardia africana TaxID=134964 RepID=A0ABW6NF62_9NOCA
MEPAPARSAVTRLFDPHSIAVVGASADPGKRGYQAVRALQEAGYDYPVYPVNPRGGRILGLEVASSIEQLPYGVDVALIALPAAAVPDALRHCAAVGIPAAVVLANGFEETGAAGAQVQTALARAIADTGIRVVGPNTSGLLNLATGANLVGIQNVPAGAISAITQSGNMLLSLINDLKVVRGTGIHAYVGLGNQVDVSYDECLAELARHPETGVIAIHIEGFTDGRAFLRSAARAIRETPVVVLRGGRSTAGRATARSHTASVAGSDAVAAAVLRQAGVESVDRSDELAVLANALASTEPMPAGRRVVVLSDGGGHAALAADALAAAGVELAWLTDDTRDALRRLLGPAAAVFNPVDVAGATDTDPALFADVVEILTDDPAVGLVLIVGMYGGYHLRFDAALAGQEAAASARLLERTAAHGVPLVVHSCYAGEEIAHHDLLRAGGVTVTSSIDHAARIVAALQRRGKTLATATQRSSFDLPAPGPRLVSDRPMLDEPAARAFLSRQGIDVGAWTVAPTVADAVTAVREYRRPCALRIVSPDVVHKSDVGGVRLNVTAEAAEATAAAMIGSVTSRVPGARIDGIIVTPMAEPGVELLVGAMRDPVFGPVVAFGSGGVLVEAWDDVTFRAAPLTEVEALEMIEETRASRLLDGHRHLGAVDRKKLARLLVRVGAIAAAHPEIAELDLNPVIASSNAIAPVDVRIILSGNDTEEAER